jgi:hypothetical protein
MARRNGSPVGGSHSETSGQQAMSDKKKRPPRSSKDKPPQGMVVCSYKLGDRVIVVTQHLDARRQSA